MCYLTVETAATTALSLPRTPLKQEGSLPYASRMLHSLSCLPALVRSDVCGSDSSSKQHNASVLVGSNASGQRAR
jgi:hypothetical protein